ncbi:MAG TPA: glycosyltransferase family 4 protein [Xanthobacteraceae bacterium]|nr:glycosyltransferase family 4 protein [Xanthobacteraceae bacterium]
MVIRHFSLAVPGSLDTPTGGYAYDRRVTKELRVQGWRVDICDLGDGFPRPDAQQLARAQTMLSALPVDAPVVVDGLAFGVMDDCAAVLSRTHRLVALVHHPLALETGVSADDAVSLRHSERIALSFTRHVIVTSPQTAQILATDYGVAREKIAVAVPGTDAMRFSPGSDDGFCRLLSVGSVVPRKGYDVLIAALAPLRDLPWRLTIVGDNTRALATTAAVRDAVAAAGLNDRIQLTGAISDSALADAYLKADVFVTASHFEGYGMAATTAIACGLPIVATAGGALSQTLGGTGLLVPPNDISALRDALRRMITDPDLRENQCQASRMAAAKLPNWGDTAARFAAAIESVT